MLLREQILSFNTMADVTGIIIRLFCKERVFEMCYSKFVDCVTPSAPSKFLCDDILLGDYL